ncbi:amidase [Pandoraea communis]|uniref:Amidase n=2 Tax=Burkholderiaceae TaxID=119060 RepID=A0A5E4XUQ2_9BURK|nr:Glutamyl-tRNA(Gln) amidotransferase subunit A [Pandoraea apista]VVE39993.1 amidase [Pandoraea communis]
MGSRAFASDSPAASHAEIVDLLIDANWRIVGKANMHELAFGMTGINDYAGTPTNPQGEELIPGGSSSGSAAAVGRGLAQAAIGTDTGGSIRGPASCCGVIGLKPTFGRVSRIGVLPMESSLDCVGPFARSMSVITDVMSAIAPNFDSNAADFKRVNAAGVRVGMVRAQADSAITSAIKTTIYESGLAHAELDLLKISDAFNAGLTVINAETWLAFGHLCGKALLGPDIEARLLSASRESPSSIAAAEVVRKVFTAEVDNALDQFDVLVLPTMPAPPITLNAARGGASVIGLSSLIRPFNLSGHPAISIPVPVFGHVVLAGLQVVGRRGADERICAIAQLLEASMSSRLRMHRQLQHQHS